MGEAFRGDHKAALDALKSTTTLQFEYLDALLRPGQSPLSAGGASSRGSDGRGGRKARGSGGGGVGWGGASTSQADMPQQRSFSSLAAGLDEGDRLLHMRLLVRFRPHEVYPFLSTSTG